MATLEEVTEQLAALKQQLEAMEPAGAAGGGDPQPVPVIKVMAPREKKLRKYAGGRDDKLLEDWISDAQRAVSAQKLTDREAVDFLYHNLEGVARDEIRLRPSEDWDKPDKVYAILRDVFSEKLTKTQLLQKFFGRRQKERESIQDYSHALMSSVDHLLKTHPGSLDNKNQNLRDTFVENLKDGVMRRELRRMIREHPTKTFDEIRDEARRTVEELDRPTRQPASREVLVEECVQVNSLSMTKTIQDLTSGQKTLVEQILQQQKILNDQQKLLTSITEKLNRPPPPPQRRPYNGPKRCFNCQEAGHIRPNCPKLASEKSQVASNPNPSRQ